jgi:hypothetical protein
MKEPKVLKILDIFRGFFQKIGIDYPVMRRILQVKLILDGRRVSTVLGTSRKSKNREENQNFLKSLGLYGLLGLMLIPLILMGKNYIFQMSLFFGILMFMVMTALISDFSSVLLDTKDKNIIFSRPVAGKTLSMARTLHVLIYMFSITMALAGPALVAAVLKQGIAFFLILLSEIILMDLLIIVLTALLYLFILKFFDGEKLKDIINYVQIILSITMVIGYQLLGRLFNIHAFNMVFTPKWWQYFVIPIWFGGPFELILQGNGNIHFILFSSLAVSIPILAIILYVRLLPTFERNLQKLDHNSSKNTGEHKHPFHSLAKFICPKREERTFFRFALNMLKNEREFKLKVYPSLGMALVFPFIFIFKDISFKGWQEIVASKAYLNIYFSALFVPTVLMMLKYSGKHKGAWIYGIMPQKDTQSIFRGTTKAFLIRLLLPVFLIESIIFLKLFGVRILPDLMVVLLNILLYTVICLRGLPKALPFSQPFEATQQSEGFLIIPFMLVLGLLAGIHYFSSSVNYGIYMYMATLGILNVFIWKKGFKLSI